MHVHVHVHVDVHCTVHNILVDGLKKISSLLHLRGLFKNLVWGYSKSRNVVSASHRYMLNCAEIRYISVTWPLI